jgi:hypothetical protein
MKKTLCLAVVLGITGAISAFGGQQIKRDTWSGVQTYDLPALQKIEGSRIGQVVGIRFNYRGDRFSHLKPTWSEGSIWRYRPADKNKFPFLRVMVEKKDLPSFKSITTDFNSPVEIVVYGKVGRDTQANFLFIQLYGRKVTSDAAGNATIDW